MKPVTKTTVVVTKTKTITLTEEETRAVLREHFKMPKAEVTFDTNSYGDFRGVELEETEVNTSEEES